MKLAVSEAALTVYQLKGMDSKPSDPANRVWEPAGAKEVHQCVDTFGLVDVEVPELGIGISGPRIEGSRETLTIVASGLLVAGCFL